MTDIKQFVVALAVIAMTFAALGVYAQYANAGTDDTMYRCKGPWYDMSCGK